MAKVYNKPASKHIGVMYNWLFISLSAAAVAVLVVVLSWLISQYVLDPLLCRRMLASCGNSYVIAGNIAAIAGGVLGVILLLKLGVRRAILAPIGIIVLTWDIASFYQYLRWPEAVISLIAVYVLGLVLFVWISRIRSLPIVVLISVVVVILLRLVLFA